MDRSRHRPTDTPVSEKTCKECRSFPRLSPHHGVCRDCYNDRENARRAHQRIERRRQETADLPPEELARPLADTKRFCLLNDMPWMRLEVFRLDREGKYLWVHPDIEVKRKQAQMEAKKKGRAA